MIRDNQQLRIFFDTISENLRNAVVYSDKKNKFYIEPEWETDKISFPSLITVFDEDVLRTELAKVSYYIEKKGRKEKRFIMKYATVREGFDEEFAEERVLLDGLEDFTLEDIEFEYCYKVTGFDDEYDWRSDTEFKDGLPRGIKMALTLKNKTTKAKEKFVKTIFIAMGELGDDTK